MKPRLANLASFFLFVAVGAVIVHFVYGNSLYGASYMFGQAVSVMLVCQGVAFLLRRFLNDHKAATGFLLASTILLAMNASQLSFGFEAKEAKRLLALAEDAAQIHLTARQNPSNRVIQLTAAVLRKSEEAHVRATQLIEGIEPSGLAKEPQPGTAARIEMETYRNLLAEAERRARAAAPQYSDVLSQERAAVIDAHKAISTNEDLLRETLKGVDKRHASARDLMGRFFEARTAVYSAYGKVYDLLIAQHGRFQFKNGKFIFVDQATADRWNSLASEYTKATQRVEAISKQAEAVEKDQADNWRRILTN